MTRTVAVVGLGYVGLPLAIEFGKHGPTIGYDLSQAKISAYQSQRDPTGEVAAEEFKARNDGTAELIQERRAHIGIKPHITEALQDVGINVDPIIRLHPSFMREPLVLALIRSRTLGISPPS